MDIQSYNLNKGITTKRQINILEIERFQYKKSRFSPVYDDEFISKFPKEIQDILIRENQKYEDQDDILLTPHPIPYNDA